LRVRGFLGVPCCAEAGRKSARGLLLLAGAVPDLAASSAGSLGCCACSALTASNAAVASDLPELLWACIKKEDSMMKFLILTSD
jgi:hypothetical protein